MELLSSYLIGADYYDIIEPTAEVSMLSPFVTLSSLFHGWYLICFSPEGYVYCYFSPTPFSFFCFSSPSLDIAGGATYLSNSCFLVSPRAILLSRAVRLIYL